MLIASKFARPDAPIELGDRTYFFRPGHPNARPDEHVCEVTDNTHIQRLLSIQEGYYIPEPVTPPPPAARPQAPAAPAATAPPTVDPVAPPAPAAATTDPIAPTGGEGTGTETAKDGSGAGEGNDAPELDADEVAAAAAKLLDLSWQKVLQQVKLGGIPKPVLEEALKREQARSGDDEPRATVVKALTAALAS